MSRRSWTDEEIQAELQLLDLPYTVHEVESLKIAIHQFGPKWRVIPKAWKHAILGLCGRIETQQRIIDGMRRKSGPPTGTD
jgi:hypothetical protein